MNTALAQFTKTWSLISLSFCAGLALMFLQPVKWLQPPWVVIILLYWILMKPQYVSIGIAWIIGVFLDAIYNTTIGEHGLALVLIAFVLTRFRNKIISLGFWKSSLVIFGLIFLYQTIQFLMKLYSGDYINYWDFLSKTAISALVWPLLALLLFNLQEKLKI